MNQHFRQSSAEERTILASCFVFLIVVGYLLSELYFNYWILDFSSSYHNQDDVEFFELVGRIKNTKALGWFEGYGTVL